MTESSSANILDKLKQQVLQDLATTEIVDLAAMNLEPHQIVLVDVPAQEAGDLGFHCGVFAQYLKITPVEIAQQLSAQLQPSHDGLIKEYVAVGPYVNLEINHSQFTSQVVTQVLQQRESYGATDVGQGQHVVIDMSSPNIAKRMSVGHLRSTVIGDALAMIHAKLGFKVTKDNHLGDWGTQFGHLLYAIELWGDETAIAQSPIPELQKLYVKVSAVGDPKSAHYAEMDPAQAEVEAKKVKDAGRQWFKKLEDGDEQAVARWQQIVDWSLQDFNKIYDLLGVEFNLTLGESFYQPMLPGVIDGVRSSGIGQESNGALIVDLEDAALGVSIIKKADGATIYMTRDIAAVIYRADQLKADKIIYVVGDDQAFYFKQLFEIIRRLGYKIADQLIHVQFGMIRLPEGKMSTRKGRVVILEDVITEAMSRAEKLVAERTRVEDKTVKAELVQQIAIGAIKWADLSGDPKRTITFDWDKIISLEGNSAAYVQYAYARAQSLMQKGQFSSQEEHVGEANNLLIDPAEFSLALKISKFEEAVQNAANDYNPSLLATYLYELARTFTAYYHSTQIVSDDAQITAARLCLINSFALVLKQGLGLMGIAAPARM